MEQHAVVSNNFVGFIFLPGSTLRVATAQVSRRQHGLYPRMPQHGLGCQADLTEQALRATPRKGKYRLGIGIGGFRVADNRDVISVFNVQQGTCGFFRQAARHFFVNKVNYLLFDRRRTHGSTWLRSLLFCKYLQHLISQTLHFESYTYHGGTHQFDGLRIGSVQKEHSRCITGTERFFTHFAQ